MCASKGGTYESFIHSVEDKMRWIRCSGIMYSLSLSQKEREGGGVGGWKDRLDGDNQTGTFVERLTKRAVKRGDYVLPRRMKRPRACLRDQENAEERRPSDESRDHVVVGQ